jgi:raffinose/stachyose/melibiose transport system permease protein
MGAASFAKHGPAPRARLASLGSEMWRKRTAYLFLLGTFALLITFEYWPFILAVVRSFFVWDGRSLQKFTGVSNYVQILTDPVFWKAMRNVAIMMAFNLTLPLAGPIVSAELLYNLRSQRARYFWRVVMIIPSVVPGMVGTLLWGYIYNAQNGFLNIMLKSVGLPPQTWLSDPKLALPSLLFVGFPWVGGTWMLVYLAGLLNIPSEIKDASVVDGCSTWRRIVAIDLPLLLGQIKLSVILTCMGTLQGFVGTLVLTNGGPFFATIVPGIYLYNQAFGRSRLGYASAVGVIMSVLILGLTIINNKYVKSSVEYEA